MCMKKTYITPQSTRRHCLAGGLLAQSPTPDLDKVGFGDGEGVNEWDAKEQNAWDDEW